jgi:hypothetical protein
LARYAPVVAVIMFAVAFRLPQFFNPDVDFDEPFYLLVGDQLLKGATVYVDIWDRKPIGLFLIYAAARLLGGSGLIQYLFVAAVFAGATSAFVWAIARRYVGAWPATLPAIIYLVWQEPYNGGGGQSAIFYNLFTIIAVWLVLRAKDLGRHAQTLKLGAGAMLLIGLAIQVKYTVLPEGMFLGLALLVLLWRQGVSVGVSCLWGVLLAAIAVAPTAAVSLYYVAIGHWPEFYYANFLSIFDRGSLVREYVWGSLAYIVIVSMPLTTLAVLGLRNLRTTFGDKGHEDYIFLIGWTIAALLGFLMIGNFYYYYFMPVLLPLSILTATHFRARLWRILTAFLLIWWPVTVSQWPHLTETRNNIRSMAKLTDTIQPLLRSGKLYVFDGPPALYMSTGTKPLSRYAYPDHLSNDVERLAIGSDSAVELKRILDQHPDVIVVSSMAVVPLLNRVNARRLRDTLARDYIQRASIRHRWRDTIVFSRRGAHEPAVPVSRWTYPTELTEPRHGI